MGGRETVGDYYRRLDKSLSSTAVFVNCVETPARMREMVYIADAFRIHGLTSPELSFVSPDSALKMDQDYPINPYSMSFADSKTFGRLVDLVTQKREEYLEAGIQGEMIERILGVIVDTTLSEISEREKERKRLVSMQVSESEGAKKRRPRRSVQIVEEVREAVEKVRKDGGITPEALQRSGVSKSTLSKVFRGQDRVAESTAAALALLGGLRSDSSVADTATEPKSDSEMIEYCRDLIMRTDSQEVFNVQSQTEIDPAIDIREIQNHL